MPKTIERPAFSNHEPAAPARIVVRYDRSLREWMAAPVTPEGTFVSPVRGAIGSPSWGEDGDKEYAVRQVLAHAAALVEYGTGTEVERAWIARAVRFGTAVERSLIAF